MKKNNLSRKDKMPPGKKLLSLTVISTTACLLFLFLTSCLGFPVMGSGKVISQERQVSGVKSISIGSSMNLIIEQGANESMRIETDDNVIPFVTSQVSGGELAISLKPVSLGITSPINCFVTVKDLNKIKVSSSATVKCEDLKTEKLSLAMASSSRGNLNIQVTNLDLSIGSSASLTISGQAVSQDIKLSSSGKLDAFNLVSKDCKISAQSSGYANINVSEKLEAQVSSSAQVNYKGDPEVSSNISSSGSLNKVVN